MSRYTKYKQVCKLALSGSDDINNTTSSSQYIVYPSKINGVTDNSKCITTYTNKYNWWWWYWCHSIVYDSGRCNS